jgi:hypothetical protein
MGYMPAAEAAYLAWSANFIDVVNQHKSAWGIPDAKVTEMQGLQTEIEALHTKCLSNEGTRTDTLNKNGKILALKHKEEALVAQLQAADYMTDPWRLDLGITVKDSDPSPVSVLEDPPEWSMRNNGYLKIRYEIRPAGTEKPRIPKGYNGAIVRFTLADAPVTDVSQLTRSQLLNKGISDMQLGPEADGKYLSCALEWETHTNKHGPLSPVQSIKVR